MRRDLDEVVASQKKMLERSASRRTACPTERVKLMFRTHLEATEAWLAKWPGIRVLRVEYRDVVERPRGVGRADRVLPRRRPRHPPAMAAIVDLRCIAIAAEPSGTPATTSTCSRTENDLPA